MSYAFAPPKALAALIIFAAHQRQANQQHYDSYNKINCKVIYIIHLLIRPSFFPPQSAGRIRAIYFFFLSAPFAMLVYNTLVKYERGSSSTACALRQMIFALLSVNGLSNHSRPHVRRSHDHLQLQSNVQKFPACSVRLL